MRRIAHISDLHFGAEEPTIGEGLLFDLEQIEPDLVVVSGDLTQRARRGQFAAARDYLACIDAPQIIVPGNHDIPLYNVVARFFLPLRNYHQYITTDMAPFYCDTEIAVAGVNTARSNVWKEGRISLAQIEQFKQQFDSAPESAFKILVGHHPFLPPENEPSAAVVGNVKLALRTLEACGCSLILAGHLHLAYSGDVRPRHVEMARSIVVAQAGTAISHRRRDEPNAYNCIVIDGERMELETRCWNGAEFASTGVKRFTQQPTGWLIEPTDPARAF